MEDEGLPAVPTSGLASGIAALAEVSEASAAANTAPKRELLLSFEPSAARPFFYFWSGNFLSNIGTWMQNLAQGWLVLQLTNSSFWLGFVAFVAAIPFLWFTL